MANHLDLEEQEQLDELKHFWKQYGNAITWLLILVLGCVATWNGYQYWQRSQSTQAAAMFDEVIKVAGVGDTEKTERAFGDMRDRFASSTYTSQAGLMVAKSLYESGKLDSAKSTLKWVAEKSADQGYAAIAKLRFAAVLMDEKAFDEALKSLDSVVGEPFVGLAADRRGDIFMALGKKAEAKTEYLKAYKAMDSRTEYRRLVEVKLNAMGVNPALDEVAK
jgi:predicted negative regulator of RcsB-dependent stress response